MPTRRTHGVRFWNGSSWTEQKFPIYANQGRMEMNRLWYSNDGLSWAPVDQADVAQAPPTVPNSAYATVNSSSQITVGWSPPSSPNDLAAYQLRWGQGYVPADMTSGSLLTTTTGTSYVHSGIADNTYHGYRVAGITADGQLGPSATMAGTTPAAYTDYYQEFGITGVGAYSAAGWEAQSYAGRVRQGNSSGNAYTGEWYYGSGLKNTINGATILSGDFRFSRQTASGPTGNVTVQVGLHGSLSRPASTGWNGAAPATNTIARLEFKWWHGGGGGGTASNWAHHIANDINGAWRGLQCGGYGIDINYTYVSYGDNKDAANNDPAGQLRVWWRRYN